MLSHHTQKITAHLPIHLLEEAQAVTKKGITETLKIALEQLARTQAYEGLRKLRGKVKINIDIHELRKDR